MSASEAPPRQNLRDWVAGVVRDRILDGRLRPGERIDQSALAAEMQTSKLPVREALIQLERIGLVRNVPYGGSFVVELEPDELRDTYRIFGMASGLAAERAAETLTDADLDRLTELVDRIDDGGSAGDEAHMAFHRTINRAGASRRMRNIIGLLLDSLPVRAFDFTELWIEGAQRDHRTMLEHLRNRDGAAAGAATAEHFVNGGERVVEALRARGYWDGEATSDEPADG